ncbi:MAG: flagellar biosynthesis protein FlhA [Planctomycetales bacterium]|nr:flagellar biosynthesis protein FlhA [Planctomycetales bacterium]
MASEASAATGLLSRGQDLILPIAIIASVLVILVPLPPALMDVLLAGNITIAVIVLLTTIYVRTPLEFSIFPSLLLATTLARLVLNVATTRLILTRAATDDLQAAGGVITAFADFVAGDGKVVVGLIIFVIIVVIQFVVITKGATRISEVAARFALDGMPGKQMAIDADLNAGIIDEREAQQRREAITQQADFYGAMDGASKFVRGDAVAGIVITVINVLGGLIIGMAEYNMPLIEAGSLFTRLTIGDGLVSQVPAFLISLAAGLLVTRTTGKSNLPRQFISQLFSRPQAMAVAGGFLAVLVMTDLPRMPLMVLCGACLGMARVLTQKETQSLIDQERVQEQQPEVEERIEDYLTVDPMEVEVGVGLIRLADPKRGGDLLERIQRVRQSVASEIGIIMPKVRIRDNMRLEPNEYRIKIADMPVAHDMVEPGHLLAIDSGLTTGKVDGIDTKDPAFGTDARWIVPALQDQAEMLGYTVVEPSAVLATHLTEICRGHADEILTRDATKHLVDELKQTQPAVVEELIPGLMTLAEVQGVLQLLLREQVSVRQFALILETLGDYASRTKDPILLAEYVRHRLARQICTRYRDNEGRLHVVALDPAMEDRIRAGFEHTDRGLFVRMSPQAIEATCNAISQEVMKLTTAHHTPIVLVSPQIRAALKQIVENHLPQLVVMSFNEVTRDTQLVTVGLASDT